MIGINANGKFKYAFGLFKQFKNLYAEFEITDYGNIKQMGENKALLSLGMFNKTWICARAY